MLDPRAFIAIEDTFTNHIRLGWHDLNRGIADEVQALVDAGKYDDAHAKVDTIHMNQSLDGVSVQMETLGITSLLFGAQNYKGRVKDTSVYQTATTIPVQVQQVLQQLQLSLAHDGAETIREAGHNMLRALEVTTVKKSDGMAAAILNNSANEVAKLSANLTTSRIATFGFLTEAMIDGATTYQVNEVLDQKTCPICQYMHGKTFDIQYEYARTVVAMSTQDPQELRYIAPWPSQSKEGLRAINRLNEPDMQQRGFGSPPYHPFCRGFLTKVGTVETKIPVGGMLLAFPSILYLANAARLSLDMVTDPELKRLIGDMEDKDLQQAVIRAFLEGGVSEAKGLLSEIL